MDTSLGLDLDLSSRLMGDLAFRLMGSLLGEGDLRRCLSRLGGDSDLYLDLQSVQG